MSIGEAPVNSIGIGLSESRLAQITLDNVSREIQKRGWWFNTETMTIHPNSENVLQLPHNTLSLNSGGRRYVMRYGQVYDKQRNTFKFDKAMPFELVLALEWDALPETARALITAKAAMRFQSETLGSAQVNSELAAEANMALMELNEEETEAVSYNIFENPNLMQDAYLYRRR